jgi:hypothetical protein
MSTIEKPGTNAQCVCGHIGMLHHWRVLRGPGETNRGKCSMAECECIAFEQIGKG